MDATVLVFDVSTRKLVERARTPAEAAQRAADAEAPDTTAPPAVDRLTELEDKLGQALDRVRELERRVGPPDGGGPGQGASGGN